MKLDQIFNEQTLLSEIQARWGEHGAHAEVFKDILKELSKVKEERDRLLTQPSELNEEAISIKEHLIQINTHGEASWLIMELAEKWRSEQIYDSKFREDVRGVFDNKLKEDRQRVIEEVKKLRTYNVSGVMMSVSRKTIELTQVLSLLTPKETPENSGLNR